MEIALPTFAARQVRPSFIVGGKDVLQGLESNNILSFKYTDSTSDKADDLSLELGDPKRSWMFRYLPADVKKGMQCSASIAISNWKFPGDVRVFDCGIFYISDVSIKGPPNCVSIKAVSIPPNGIKGTKKFKSWENSDLKSIAGEIASSNNLTLFYDTSINPKVKRTDQADKSDIQYLRDRCKEATLSLKIHKNQIVIYSEEDYDSRPPAFTLTYGSSVILEYNFNSKLDDTYAKAKNSYINPETGKVTETEFDPAKDDGTIPDGTGAFLIENERIETDPDEEGEDDYVNVRGDWVSANDWDDDAAHNKGKGAGSKKNSDRKCKAKLREKNKKEHECSIKVLGNIEFLSGLTCQTLGFGIFDKKWFVSSSEHSIENGGYTTDLKLRGALKGY